MKTAVVYFSLFGANEKIASKLSEELRGKIHRIQEIKQRKKGFALYFTGGFQAIFGISSKIKDMDFKIDDYDSLILEGPLWGGLPCPALNAFVEKTDFTGKKVGIFLTTTGGNAVVALKKLSDKIEQRGGNCLVADYYNVFKLSSEKMLDKTREYAEHFKKSIKNIRGTK